MVSHYLLWATGADRTGIVAAVARALYENNCNIEDSSMLRLGSEFGILLIFSSPKKHAPSRVAAFFTAAEKKYSLSIGVKALSKKEAAFRAPAKNMFLVSLHGADRPGLVYKLTAALAKHKFNITDLVTHRTSQGARPGYVLFVEGEMSSAKKVTALRRDLDTLAKKLSTRIGIRSLESNPL